MADRLADAPLDPARQHRAEPRRFVSRAAWCCGLLVLALVPRALMAWRNTIVCPDATYYLQLAREQSVGDPGRVLLPDAFNVFPLALAALHEIGLDWELAGKLWNVACGSLMVLPLFGWLRRQFDDRVAMVGAAVCAVHPKLIEWSGEVVREPTFWLGFVLTLYLLWRAAEEARPAWWLLAGMALTLTTQTRAEGWVLLLPAVGWLGLQAWRSPPHWIRLALAPLLLAAAFPLVIVPINYAVHGGQAPLQWSTSLHRRLYLQAWWKSLDDAEAAPVVVSASPRPYSPVAPPVAASDPPIATTSLSVAAEVPANAVTQGDPAPPPAPVAPAPTINPAPAADRATASSPTAPQSISPVAAATPVALTPDEFSSAAAIRAWVRALLRGTNPIYLGLAAMGLVAAGRRSFAADRLPLWGMALATLGAIWVHLLQAHLTSSRYGLTIVLLASPAAAGGLLALARRLDRLERWNLSALARMALWRPAVPLLALLAVVGWADALSNPDRGRLHKAALGRWLREQAEAPPSVVGSPRLKMVEYYAQSPVDVPQPWTGSADAQAEFVAARRPDFVALSDHDLVASELTRLVDRLSAQEFVRVADEQLPPECGRHFVVLARRDIAERLARSPRASHGRRF